MPEKDKTSSHDFWLQKKNFLFFWELKMITWFYSWNVCNTRNHAFLKIITLVHTRYWLFSWFCCIRVKNPDRIGGNQIYLKLCYTYLFSLLCIIETFSEDIRVSAQRHFQGVIEAKALRIVYGSTLADNRVLTFLCPPEIGGIMRYTSTLFYRI